MGSEIDYDNDYADDDENDYIRNSRHGRDNNNTTNSIDNISNMGRYCLWGCQFFGGSDKIGRLVKIG